MVIHNYDVKMSSDLFQDFLAKNGAEFGELTGKRVVQSYGDVVAEHRSLTGVPAWVCWSGLVRRNFVRDWVHQNWP